ncbi:MAG: hypothetical protein U0350_41635 [Caldilineaceae bacterium]
MAVNIQKLQKDLLSLSLQERLRLAYWLLESVLPQSAALFRDDETSNQKAASKAADSANPLLQLAGRFASGPGDTAEKAEEILKAEVNSISGLSR